MGILVKIENPELNIGIIEIFEMELGLDNSAIFPVSINGKLYRFIKNKHGLWQPIMPDEPMPVLVRWYIGEVIEGLLQKDIS